MNPDQRAAREEQHGKDVSLLRIVLADHEFGGDKRAAFEDMLERVETHPKAPVLRVLPKRPPGRRI